MQKFRDLPIKWKLVLVILLTSTAAMFVGGAASIIYEFVRFRHAIIEDTAGEAVIIGEASAAALAFGQTKEAEQILSVFQRRPDIVSARLFRPDDSLFAEYVRPGESPPQVRPAALPEGHRFEAGSLLLMRPVTLGEERVGTIALRADLREPRARLRTYVGIAVGVMCGALLVALLVGAGLQRAISQPVLELAAMSRQVSADQDYSRRAAKRADDEIGALTDGFNQMLAAVQQREQTLEASEERFRQLAENIRQVFWMTDTGKTEMIYASPAYEEIWGRPLGGLYAEPRSWLEAVHPDDRDRIRQAAMTKQLTGEYDEEYRIARPGGSVRWIRDRAFPVRDETGKVYRIAGIAEDVTERKRAEEALRQSQQRLQAILDNTTAVIYLKDRCGRYMLINRWFQTLFHVTTEQVVDKSDYDIFSKERADAFRINDLEVLKARRPLEFEELVPQDDGLHTYISIKFPLFDATGEPYAVCGISTDITEHKRLQTQLIQAEKMESIGRLAAGVAHEVKNPLMTLAMGIDYLTQNLDAQHEETQMVLREMDEAIQRANTVAGELLDFSRPGPLRTQLENLNDIIERSLTLVRHELVRNHVTVTRELGADLPPLLLDRNKVEQVFVNLLVNAIHAMPGGGSVTVRSSIAKPASEPSVIAEIDDTGTGIPEENIAKIFDPFFTTKPTGAGSGLGLCVVKQIVEMHGGSIDIRNRSQRGVRATIIFKSNRSTQP
jgi:PAS domain S-box-containing protein